MLGVEHAYESTRRLEADEIAQLVQLLGDKCRSDVFVDEYGELELAGRGVRLRWLPAGYFQHFVAGVRDHVLLRYRRRRGILVT